VIPRAENSGRPRTKEFSQEGIIAKQEARIKLLEGQVELLKKPTRLKGGW
jgi:hypothetical protein